MRRSFMTTITAGTVAAVVLAFGVGLAPASADDSDGPSQTTSTEHDGGTGFTFQSTSVTTTDTGTVSDTETVDTVETGTAQETATASETETVDAVDTATASETETVDSVDTATVSETETAEASDTGTTTFTFDTATALPADTATAGAATPLADLDPGELEQASPDQFGTVSASEARRFTPAQVHVLDTAQFQALGTDARGALTRAQAHSLKPGTVARAGDALLALSPAALAALPLSALRHLRGSAWLRDLTPAQIAALNSRQARALGLAKAGLSADQRAALSVVLHR